MNVEDYPSIKKHLDKYFVHLEKRADKGDTPYNLRNCAYIEDFFKQKVVWNRIASEKLFSFVEEGIFIQDSMHFFTGSHLKYLCAVLNSKLFVWFMYLLIGDAAGGNAGNSDNIKNLTIPKPSPEIEEQIEKALKQKQYDKINYLIYDFYRLSATEIEFIEQQ